MKIVTYDPKGRKFSDDEAEACAAAFLEFDHDIKVSTSNFIFALRCLIAESDKKHEVEVHWNEHVMPIDCNGWLPFAQGFLMHLEHHLCRIAKANKRKREKK